MPADNETPPSPPGEEEPRLVRLRTFSNDPETIKRVLERLRELPECA